MGLGVSGPQVVEGLHGASFAKPLGRLRECVEILRIALAGEKIAYEGEHYLLPRPDGEGKAIRLSQPPRPELPIYLATLGPKSLQMTGELANGWLGTCFLPEHAHVFLDDLTKGAQKAGRGLADIDIQAGGYFEISDDVEGLINKLRPGMAFTLGLQKRTFIMTLIVAQGTKRSPRKFKACGSEAIETRQFARFLMNSSRCLILLVPSPWSKSV